MQMLHARTCCLTSVAITLLPNVNRLDTTHDQGSITDVVIGLIPCNSMGSTYLTKEQTKQLKDVQRRALQIIFW